MKEANFFTGTYAEPGEDGIFLYKADFSARKFTRINSCKDASNPSYLLRHKSGLLYAVEEMEESGNVSVFSADDFGFRKLATLPAGGRGPCHLALDEDENFLFVSNYTSGSISMLELADDGIPKEMCCLIEHTGKGVNPDRQEAPHVHFSRYSNGFLYVCDLGLDTVFCYKVNVEEKRLEETGRNIALPDGSGPRHLVLHPQNNEWLYVLTELSSRVFTFRLENGYYVQKQDIASLPDGVPKGNSSAAIKMSEDGRYLFVSNRGADTITAYAVDENGLLKLLDVCETGGRAPRDFSVSGDFFIIANQDSGTLTAMCFDREKKRLELLDMNEKAGRPVCILKNPCNAELHMN